MARNEPRQIAQYVEFVDEGLGSPGVWLGLKGQVFPGTDAFAQAMQQRLNRDEKHASREIPRLQRRAG